MEGINGVGHFINPTPLLRHSTGYPLKHSLGNKVLKSLTNLSIAELYKGCTWRVVLATLEVSLKGLQETVDLYSLSDDVNKIHFRRTMTTKQFLSHW